MNAAQQGMMAEQQWQPSAQDVDNIARICHEANRAICICNKDLSQPAWDDAPDWQKESARKGVLFHISNPYANSKDSHDQWMETKLRDGWRFGPVKDAIKKMHPSLLPYHALPDTEKVKDDIFKAIVTGYVEALRRKNFK